MSVGLLEIPSYVTGSWTIDPAHSDVGFGIRHLMISNVKGHFTRFEGRIVTAADPLDSEVTATIDMTSIDFAPDPATGARAGFTATGEINRMDFGISYNGPIPGGGVTLGEKVQIVLEIEAVLQPAAA